MVYTTRFARGGSGPNGFEHLLKRLGITQKNGSPSHPQTQGKICEYLSWCCAGPGLTLAKN